MNTEAQLPPVMPPLSGHLAAALAKAQGDMKAAVFNRVNPHFKNRYADLAAVLDAVRGPLSRNGIGHTQVMEFHGETLMLVTTLHHTSGQTISSYYPLPANAKPQELGSALTYARRYSLSAIVGIAADEDDDAEAASKGHGAKITPEQVEHLQILLEATGTDAKRFKSYIGKLGGIEITKLEDIPASQFEGAFAALNKKEKKIEVKP